MTLRDVLLETSHAVGLPAEKACELEYVVAESRNWTRSELLLHLNDPVDESLLRAAFQAAQQLAQGYPAEYIVGSAAFRDIILRIENGVLVPRPETEELVQMALDSLRRYGLRSPTILDVCSGSGAIAMSIAMAVPDAKITGLENDATSVACSRRSAQDMDVSARVRFVQANVLASWLPALGGMRNPVDMIVSNPPYVRLDRLAQAHASSPQEPIQALYGGVSGLLFYRRIIAQARKWLKSGGFLLLEIDDGLEGDILELCKRNGFQDGRWLPDLRGLPRYVEARRA